MSFQTQWKSTEGDERETHRCRISDQKCHRPIVRSFRFYQGSMNLRIFTADSPIRRGRSPCKPACILDMTSNVARLVETIRNACPTFTSLSNPLLLRVTVDLHLALLAVSKAMISTLRLGGLECRYLDRQPDSDSPVKYMRLQACRADYSAPLRRPTLAAEI